MARKLIGRVISDKMEKTVIVAVERLKIHPIYKKRYKATSKFKAHDENNLYKLGDMVEIVQVPPISKQKRFAVASKVKYRNGARK